MLLFLLAASLAFAADESPAVTQARQELVRVREQVNAGLLAASKVQEAQETIDDALDQQVLDRTLYGHITIEDLSEQQALEMQTAAQRRVDRVQRKVDRTQALIASGIAAPGMFADITAELARRHDTLTQANTRAEVLSQIVEMARAEAAPSEGHPDALPGALRGALPGALPGEWKAREFVDGDHLLEPQDIKDITLAYESKFHEPFPVSARGATAVHRAMGFDHTGRIDVAVNPDSAEGAWLRAYLEAKEIPFYAFRAAIPGKATAPHIHIGPGSLRIRPTD